MSVNPKKPMLVIYPNKNDQLHNKTKFSTSRELYTIFGLISAIKVLLVFTYHSTDFEVHRNWLAITHSLPIKEWYVSAKSEWTLDYPPFFAWFEYCLSHLAKFFDPEMLKIDHLNYASQSTILFQRASVIISDLMLMFGVQEVGRVFCKNFSSFIVYSLLSLCNVGLLLVDHIHFQYNGFLLGILLLSIAKVSETEQVKILQGAIFFAVLLNFKHLYLYVVPAFTVWLLKWYCLRSQQFLRRFIQLGIIVVTIMLVSFSPFLSQLPQVFSRLFPFKRGLVHAYWAANIWALYIGGDKLLSVIWRCFGWLNVERTATMTGGLVQQDSLAVLPTPTPLVTFIATVLSMLPIILHLLRKEQKDLKPIDFVRCLILCGLSSFIFGWHVHEKAILTAIIPLCVLATQRSFDARLFIILSSAGHTAILPLLFPKNLIILKITMVLMYQAAAIICLQRLFKQKLLRFHEWIYIGLLPFLTFYESIFHKVLFADYLPFLPLAVTSIYCAVGVVYSWIFYCYIFYYDCEDQIDTKTLRVHSDKTKSR